MSRSFILAVLMVAGTCPALAGPAYTPVSVQPPATVTPPTEMIADVTAFFSAVKSGDGDSIARGMADKITVVSGALDMDLPRTRETLGPFTSVEAKLAALSAHIGGDVEEPQDGSDPAPLQIRAERQFIVESLSDGGQWGSDPMIKDAICSYAFRSFDAKAVGKVAKSLGIAGSSFTAVLAPYQLREQPNATAPVVSTLETNLLYALDYRTDAPSGWIAVFVPDGRTGFAKFDDVQFDRPYASGICFRKQKDGHWAMVAQASTGL